MTVPSSLHGFRFWMLIGGLMLGVYLVGLDMTMLATVTPRLTDYFHTLSDVSWYETTYVLVVCVFIPLAGKAYTLFPNNWKSYKRVGINWVIKWCPTHYIYNIASEDPTSCDIFCYVIDITGDGAFGYFFLLAARP
ncbi:hypothetical protein EYZ11_003574 [Aspergillus tanneri]|uniref:Major facilitator superfamily (MFS) profile domain-containing protein n=1 Tax=Aspergillus tanneri TaxID=1220188 RepID=A0A4S3JMX5_9EURO|nr:hypothetical protein EYZ11_003574 [Aspergillus tanneri]